MRTSPTRRFITTIATLCACFLLLGILAIQMRYVGVTLGLVPTTRVQAEALCLPTTSHNEAIVAEYCSEAVTISDFTNLTGRASTNIALDDAWFFRDAHSYQHELATACAVLTAICNSESQYYSDVEGAVPYAEQTLSALGFRNIRTESYAMRSSILDQLGALFAGDHDVAAYTFASKTIPSPDGEAPVTLIFVGIRGSYGVEWLSNFNYFDTARDKGDQPGFKAAKEEIERELVAYAQKIGGEPEHTRILITGHSRGGAIANLLAAHLDELSKTTHTLAPATGIYTYTFATPGTTCRTDFQSDNYSNIFNIVNSSDIIAQLPLSNWGYNRYGTTVSLPSVTNPHFNSSYQATQQTFQQNTGVALSFDKDALTSLTAFGEQTEGVLPTPETLMSPEGILHVAQALFRLNFDAALSSHYPDTYIAWMQSTSSANLSFE